MLCPSIPTSSFVLRSFGDNPNLTPSMSDFPPSKRSSFFERRQGCKAFAEAYLTFARKLLEVERTKLVPISSAQRFFHGSTHVTHFEQQPRNIEMSVHSVEMRTAFNDIASGNDTIIAGSLSRMVESISHQFKVSFYQTINDTCDEHGNTIQASRDTPLEAQIKDMLEKVEFAVDREGNVQLPQIHASPEMAERLLRLENEESPEIEALIARKSEAALVREEDRKRRFKDYGK